MAVTNTCLPHGSNKQTNWGFKMSEINTETKQTAIEKLTKAEKFILICGDEDNAYYSVEGISLNDGLGHLERVKYRMLLQAGDMEV